MARGGASGDLSRGGVGLCRGQEELGDHDLLLVRDVHLRLRRDEGRVLRPGVGREPAGAVAREEAAAVVDVRMGDGVELRWRPRYVGQRPALLAEARIPLVYKCSVRKSGTKEGAAV